MVTVIAGIIEKDNKILIGRRGPGEKLSGLWEFPGGKLEDGETHQECLKRELKEEMGIDVKINDLVSEYVYEYPHISYQLYFYSVNQFEGELQFHTHDKIEWVIPEQFDKYDFLPGDEPILDTIRNKDA
tara:strand:+ start:87 stop:473 length:387 start_codon:yes stop_codon:yes gene_type:complete